MQSIFLSDILLTYYLMMYTLQFTIYNNKLGVLVSLCYEENILLCLIIALKTLEGNQVWKTIC